MLIVYFEPFGNADGFCVYILQTILISTVQYITCVCGWNPVKTINGVFLCTFYKKVLYNTVCCTHSVETQTGVICVHSTKMYCTILYLYMLYTPCGNTDRGYNCVHSTRMYCTILYL